MSVNEGRRDEKGLRQHTRGGFSRRRGVRVVAEKDSSTQPTSSVSGSFEPGSTDPCPSAAASLLLLSGPSEPKLSCSPASALSSSPALADRSEGVDDTLPASSCETPVAAGESLAGTPCETASVSTESSSRVMPSDWKLAAESDVEAMPAAGFVVPASGVDDTLPAKSCEAPLAAAESSAGTPCETASVSWESSSRVMPSD